MEDQVNEDNDVDVTIWSEYKRAVNDLEIINAQGTHKTSVRENKKIKGKQS